MALEWGVTPLWIRSRRTSRSSGRCRSTPRATPGSSSAGDRIVITAGHRGQHPRLDERDQGRHRVVAAQERARRANWAPCDGGASVAGAPHVASPLRWLGGRRARARRRSSTTSRCSRTSTRATRSRRGRPRCDALRQRAARAPAPARAASTSDAALAREARRLGLVKPGEQLFIVKGIDRVARGSTASARRAVDDRARRRAAARPRRRARSGGSSCAARSGRPAVTEQAPFDDDGEPFPTTF